MDGLFPGGASTGALYLVIQPPSSLGTGTRFMEEPTAAVDCCLRRST